VRARTVTIVLLVVVLVALFLPQAPAAAISGTPTVTVNPNAGLVDGQAVSVAVTDFPANTLIGVVECPATATKPEQCGSMVPVTTTTDGSGAASLTYSVTRVIFTRELGRVDCAQTACVIGAGTAFGPFVSATAAVGFLDTPLPPPPLSITLQVPHFLDQPGAFGRATLRARLTCDVTASVMVSFSIAQQFVGDGGITTAGSSFTYPCTPGVDIDVFSDYLSAFSPGDAEASVRASVGGRTVGADAGTVTLQSWDETIEALNAALAGPDGDAVRAKLIDDLKWRFTYNPYFASLFCQAIHCLG
jgi:hypothetical protein